MDLRRSVRKQNHVAIKLAKHLLTLTESNVVFSPLSLQVLISLIAAGAKGSTLDQILSFLKSESTHELNKFYAELVGRVFKDGSASGGPRLSVANGVWVDKSLSLNRSFEKAVKSHYKASVKQVDFQTKALEVTEEVNAWAEKKTRGLIKELLSPGLVDCTTSLILANALYFKGTWRKRFKVSFTTNNDFYLQNGVSVTVPFMTSYEDQFVCAFDGFKVLRLPYRHGKDDRRFSMCFFLPNDKEGLPALLEKVGSKLGFSGRRHLPPRLGEFRLPRFKKVGYKSGFLGKHLPRRRVQVGDFRIPKFKISFGFDAFDALKRLGLTLPFSSTGDLTGMVNSEENVSGMLHKSFIEVNEGGTEAAAVSVGVKTGGVMWRRDDPIDFVADHPFLFLIREDRTGLVMFFGQVNNPV